MTDINILEQQRRDNRDAIAALGLNPYGQRTDALVPLAEAKRRYDEQADAAHQAAGKEPPDGYEDKRPRVHVAGRVVLHRDNGKLIWLNLRDDSGDLQVAVSKRDCDQLGFDCAKLVDLSDIVTASGPLMRTRTGEITVWADQLSIASKSLTPPPEKWAGLTDVELRYRRRYVDLWANPDAMRTLTLRSRLIARTRRFLDERAFLEVETPMLQQLAGGAAATPFTTHMNALDLDLFMRIAPELYLKRLLVGGMPRVYELGRNFRNEGLSKKHNPEFTSLEVYQAFGDHMTMLELAESLVRELATLVALERQDTQGAPGDEDAIPTDLRLPFGDLMIDYGAPFARITFAELFENALGFPMTDEDAVRAKAQAMDLKTTGADGTPLDHILLVNELFEEVAEPTIDPAKPTFVLDYPAALSPLTRPNADNPELAGRWDLFMGGMEIGPAYTELNDPDVQDAKFREQLAGLDDEESTFRTFDEDFVDALKVGMPPAGGLGLGIDRIVMLLTDERSIRDVLAFPMMRPVVESGAPADA